MRKFALVSTAMLFFGLFVSSPVSANEAVCQGSSCEISFQFTGQPVTWSVPAGAFNLTFEAYGAQGGRNGGLGGKVTGAIASPPASLVILVGGAGSQGSHAPGGFNGGGSAGGNHSDEGSGGGASDIRVGASLSDRIVVAGGGGGTGGWSGGGGGNGGGLQGQAGISGQGGGGGGGTQTAGGQPGFSNGGTIGTAGSFGIGGTGGSSGASGGGGGGGGWYGGGGGGGDIDTCCMDGGGGGGGSSYTDASITQVQHTQGARSGHGLVIIRYLMMPTVIEFVGEQQAQLARFSLEFSEVVSGLEASDFIVSYGGCAIQEIAGNGQRFEVWLSGCPHGTLTLTLNANSVSGGSLGPAVSSTAELIFDRQPPAVGWLHEPYSLTSDPVFLLEYSEATVIAGPDQIAVLGCEGFELTAAAEGLLVSTFGCAESRVIVQLAANSFADEHLNLSPALALSTERIVDLTNPSVSWSSSEITFEVELASFSVVLSFSEPVTFEQNLDFVQAVPDSCLTGKEQSELQLQLHFSECEPGDILLQIEANALSDAAGRTGPEATSTFNVAIAVPVLEVAPQPAPIADRPITDALPTAPLENPQSAGPGEGDGDLLEPAPIVAVPTAPSDSQPNQSQTATGSTTQLTTLEPRSSQDSYVTEGDSAATQPSAIGLAPAAGQTENVLLTAADRAPQTLPATDSASALNPLWFLGSLALGIALAAGSIVAWQRRRV